MPGPLYPALYQINTRVWLTALGCTLGKTATLDDIADSELDQLATLGFDWIWLLSVWQTGPAAQAISRANAGWRQEFAHTLPDLADADIAGSGFAIQRYTAHHDLGGPRALARLRQRLHARGLKLMLDFVPNHMAPDHPWVDTHPDYFVAGSASDLAAAPQNYCQLHTAQGPRIFAHGRDPYFDGWPDTLQLDYGNPALQQAMIAVLGDIAEQCDGVRCDMAMLILPDVFQRTWGIAAAPFWPAAIAAVKHAQPGFTFMAEVYWDREWEIQQQGFDYTYDKRLYDRLRDGHAGPVRDHFRAGLDYQQRMARFLENHDEPRAAATFPPGQHQAAAVLTYLAPGLRFFHQGQFEGHTQRISPHLVRAPAEATDTLLATFYQRLLAILRRLTVRDGSWQFLTCTPAWAGNTTRDGFIAFAWQNPNGRHVLVAVNYAPTQGQCYVQLPGLAPDMADTQWQLEDLLGDTSYQREGVDLRAHGLYLDVPPWHPHVFALRSS